MFGMSDPFFDEEPDDDGTELLRRHQVATDTANAAFTAGRERNAELVRLVNYEGWTVRQLARFLDLSESRVQQIVSKHGG